jgi:hypothetical protein
MLDFGSVLCSVFLAGGGRGVKERERVKGKRGKE